jgi:class 3 adenylate cyclase
VATGIFGHRSLRQRDIFGEAVNEAAVIGHHRGIAVTGPVHEAVKKNFQTRALPSLKVKWLDQALELWEVIE